MKKAAVAVQKHARVLVVKTMVHRMHVARREEAERALRTSSVMLIQSHVRRCVCSRP